MRIAIVSGKGGTGKSSVASSLAHHLSKEKKLVLVDADSDCPNQHIFFKGKMIMKKQISVSKIALVNPDKCIGCSICEERCIFEAIKIIGKKAIVDKIGCEGCGACVVSCPEKALTLKPKQSGHLIVSKNKKFYLTYGLLFPGQSGTGKMVFNARQSAEKQAKENNTKLIIVDAPPGIGCPLIAAVTGCDYIFGVVEPTPASIKNLERVLKIVKNFKLPYSIIMNKIGISKKYEKEIRKRFGKKIIGNIAYDKEVACLLAKGIVPYYGKGKAAAGLRRMASKAEKLIKKIMILKD
ncbi:ATP-binding protein [Candidatus Micrarchaeota archaeon]|nr:ATP-binding protein [Candidatus Micrarchaeota archaeon]